MTDAAASLGVALVGQPAYWVSLLVAAPIYFFYRARQIRNERTESERRHAQEMSDLQLATIEALALAIDARDQSAQTHLRRVQVFAAGVARALDMTEIEIEAIRTAALLHDIGKLAVPEHILSKPGPLTEDEFDQIRLHPIVGAEIVGVVPFPGPVAPLILGHHERWDGNGYPAGLKGEEIPLGARILSAVDYFDALMSERPYHTPLTASAAMNVLRQESGHALDPRVVQTFVALHPTLAAEAAARQEPPRKLTRTPAGPTQARPATGLVAEERSAPALVHGMAVARREGDVLADIAQALSGSTPFVDRMALIAEKLRAVVPFSACALFVHTDAGDLACRFATGLEAEAIGHFRIANGRGLAGWVARNGQPLVDARASVDFEAAGRPNDESALSSALVCPLALNGRLLGAMAAYHVQPSTYTDEHRRLLESVCRQAAPAVHQSLLLDDRRGPRTGRRPRTRVSA